MNLSGKNLLGEETSPYLRQHQGNPVHWMPWGAAAFARARAENKPVLLSVGYAACHWCHVMAHESFEDAATADLMNSLYVCIKVDREELPDVDTVYQAALALMGQQGGWPLTVFLTPEGEAFWGGTYFPPHPRHGLPSFREVLRGVAEAWTREPDKITHNSQNIRRALQALYTPNAAALPLPAQAAHFGDALLQRTDPVSGGFGDAEQPKFPCLSALSLLWNCHIRTGMDKYKSAVVQALTAMCQGGLYDHIGGGFFRYTVDSAWEIPHFEKMLADNALFIDLLAEVYRETQNPLFAARVEQTVEWLLREMGIKEGVFTAFASSLDADSMSDTGAEEEGAFYIWRAQDVDDALGTEAADFRAAYDISKFGNWPGQPGYSIPNRLAQAEWRGADEARYHALARKLRFLRDVRSAPARDDKILCDLNALAAAALCRAAFVFEKPAWQDAALSCFNYLRECLRAPDGHLARSRCDGKNGAAARLDDYAHFGLAALALFENTGDAVFLADATASAKIVMADFSAASGGYYMSPPDAAPLPLRPLHADDNAMPSGNAVFIKLLSRLSALSGDVKWQAEAEKAAVAFAGRMAAHIFPHAALIEAAWEAQTGICIVISGNDAAARAALQDVLRGLSLPAQVLHAQTQNALPETHPAYGKKTDAAAAAWICAQRRCLPPVSSPQTFREMLRAERQGMQRPPANDE
ncbi:MAG TPA: thioredoxin domain-containing protein [Alphaproteobacteria bacterium]|nr:thioredoxin domain-containing protein [Alphaproteobacteria bacterium]